MIIYTFTDSRGINHDIRERDIQQAYRTLLHAGFDLHEAHEKSLDYVLAQLQLSSVSEENLLYANHPYTDECALTSLVAHRLMVKETQKERQN